MRDGKIERWFPAYSYGFVNDGREQSMIHLSELKRAGISAGAVGLPLRYRVDETPKGSKVVQVEAPRRGSLVGRLIERAHELRSLSDDSAHCDADLMQMAANELLRDV